MNCFESQHRLCDTWRTSIVHSDVHRALTQYRNPKRIIETDNRIFSCESWYIDSAECVHVFFTVHHVCALYYAHRYYRHQNPISKFQNKKNRNRVTKYWVWKCVHHAMHSKSNYRSQWRFHFFDHKTETELWVLDLLRPKRVLVYFSYSPCTACAPLRASILFIVQN